VREDPVLRRLTAVIFAGDPRVWRVAALFAVPLVLLTCFYCLKPQDYNTGTDNVEVRGYVVRAAAHQRLCVPGLLVPARTARVRLRVLSFAPERPSLHLALRVAGTTLRSRIGPTELRGDRTSSAVFGIPQRPPQPAAAPAVACVTADGPVSWGGTRMAAPPSGSAPTLAGAPLRARVAVWYVPPVGAQRSYLSAAGTILSRASLFRPGWVGPWLYALMLLVVLPGLAFAAVRCLALAVRGRSGRLGAWLFCIAAVNFACWALITPPFQAPDEVDHFAYSQALAERGHRPSRDPGPPLQRWSSAEALALEAVAYATDHRAADARPPWLALQERRYQAERLALNPRADDGGGYQTAATHGPIYYGALAPAYLAAGTSPFSQLTLMRLASALLGALTVLCTYLLARELAPGRQWIAVVAALLVAFQPMYASISGAVNNDVGLNAGAAALVLLLIRIVRRGMTVTSGALTGALLLALPVIKGTGLSLYPVAGFVLLAVLWRRHTRADLPGWIALACGAAFVGVVSELTLGGIHTSAAPAGASAVGATATAVGGALGDIPGFLSYLWQVFLPRLPSMAPHFPAYPAYSIFVVRGWAAFGSYTVAFPTWVYVAIVSLMLSAIALAPFALRREWSWVRSHSLELTAVVATPIAVIVGFEAAYYTPGIRPVIAEVGRYVFPAIGPLAVLLVGALHAVGRRRMLPVAIGVLLAVISLSYASQLLTLSSFYA
jgi:hypothetical protein